MPFNLGFHKNYTLILWCILFHSSYVSLMNFEILFKIYTVHYEMNWTNTGKRNMLSFIYRLFHFLWTTYSFQNPNQIRVKMFISSGFQSNLLQLNTKDFLPTWLGELNNVAAASVHCQGKNVAFEMQNNKKHIERAIMPSQ